MTPVGNDTLHFAGFEVRQAERRVLVNGRPVTVHSRAFDLLMALVERADRVVSTQELIDIVWRQFRREVDSNNVQVHVSALRKALGRAVITTVPGRGYRFTAEPPLAAQQPPAGRATEVTPRGRSAEAPASNLPQRLPPLYGRDDDVQTVRSLLSTHRLVTISGAGGIGKTRLAQAAVHGLQSQWPEGVWWVELASVTETSLLAPIITQAMGLHRQGVFSDSADLAHALGGQSVLLVLDNCEHLVEAVGTLVQELLQAVPGMTILVTTQELLRLPQEQVVKLPPLSVPSATELDAAETYGAVQLFVARVRALDRRFVLNDENLPAVLDICRRLDGIALAIELAAARVPVLGVPGLRDRLDERFRVLTGGSRMALRRHQTLRAALEWSHHLLSADEQTLFRRLGLFSNGFVMETAQAMASDDAIDSWQVLDLLAALLDKSLLVADDGERPRYRMLETTRAYALERLAEANETDAWLRRHAQATRALLEKSVKARDTDRIWTEMANVRAAFAWAMDPGGDAESAVALATHSAMVLTVMGLGDEAMQRLDEVQAVVLTPAHGRALPAPLEAQFWQWVGRGNLGGRLPTSQCLIALHRAEGMFRSMRNQRHLHACLRMRAEALLGLGGAADLATAEELLQEAASMEYAGWPAADRLRRLRVQGLLHAAAGRHVESLASARHAFDIAQASHFERYVLILHSDMAAMQLRMGLPDEAAAEYRALAAMTGRDARHGRTHALALAGLCTALLAQGQREAARDAAAEALPLLRRCGLFVAHADIFAWLLAERGLLRTAGHLVGGADAYQRHRETGRDDLRQQARAGALARLAIHVNHEQAATWIDDGAALGEEALAAAVAEGLASADAVVR